MPGDLRGCSGDVGRSPALSSATGPLLVRGDGVPRRHRHRGCRCVRLERMESLHGHDSTSGGSVHDAPRVCAAGRAD